MASLKWLVHSACNVLGYPTKDGTITYEDAKKGLELPKTSVAPSLKGEAACPWSGTFQMPLHYPRYTKADYENMDETRLDLLLKQYGLSFEGSLGAKREFAKGAFLWPDQY